MPSQRRGFAAMIGDVLGAAESNIPGAGGRPEKDTSPLGGAGIFEVFRETFNPEGSGYDYNFATSAGLGPNEEGHWPSRDPHTGRILKGRGHSTFWKTIAGERAAGNTIRKGYGGNLYSHPKGTKSISEEFQRLRDSSFTVQPGKIDQRDYPSVPRHLFSGRTVEELERLEEQFRRAGAAGG